MTNDNGLISVASDRVHLTKSRACTTKTYEKVDKNDKKPKTYNSIDF